MLTLYHQHNENILLMWGRKKGKGFRLQSYDIFWSCAGSHWEALERFIVAPPI